MNEWTFAARRILDECLNRNRTRFAAEGAEADEVAADLRRHLEFEASEERLKVITASDVRRILTKVDPNLLEASDREGPRPSAPPPKRPPEQPLGELERTCLWLFGVVLPVVTLMLEFFVGLCASEFFDPIPTAMHVMLVALVPLANATSLLFLQRQTMAPPKAIWWLQTMAMVVAGAYALVFLPMAPFATIGIIFLGFGFLPLSPLLAWGCGLAIGHRLKIRGLQSSNSPPGDRWLGGLAVIVLLAAHVGPVALTDYWLRMVSRGSDAEQIAAVRRLRQFGNRDQILRAAYGQFGRGLIEFGWERPCTTEEAQQTYFWVTGQPYNAVPPPVRGLNAARRAALRDFEWDRALGGEAVAGRVSGLSLVSSRLDASAHASDGWGYTEWTLEFRNDHPQRQREARAILQLPPGGVVSRVTLWVNGEEREAAFAGRSAVRAAYQQVAVAERRDPILVTTAGPDRVLMQCFPVPPGGGMMKVRVGVTSPLTPLTAEGRAFIWPRMVERNFTVGESLRHHAWLESIAGAADLPTGWQRDANRENTAHATLTEGTRGADLRSIRLRAHGAPGAAWARDDRGTKPAWIRQRLETATAKSEGRLALVIDAGHGAEKWVPIVRDTLARSIGSGDIAIWLVHDGGHQLFDGTDVPLAQASVAFDKWKTDFDGGHDPVPTLEAALDWAGAAPEGTLLWIHGAQTLYTGDAAAIRQRLERSQVGAVVFDVAAADGPNQLAERLEGIGAFQTFARAGTLGDDLGRFFDRWSGLVPAYRWVLERTESQPSTGVTGSRHLVRLWAANTVGQLRAERRGDAAVSLAASWQLVTPVTGAVVLETQEQFARHGLFPVDPLTTPSVVPEPSTWALLIVGVGMVLWWGRRRLSCR